MKKLIIALIIYFLFTTSSMGASQYDGIWVFSNLQVVQIAPPLPQTSSLLKGPNEAFLVITKYGDKGIIHVVDKEGEISSGIFSIIKTNSLGQPKRKEDKDELASSIDRPFLLSPIGTPKHVVYISFDDNKTAKYQRRYSEGKAFFGHPPLPSITVEGTLHKVVEPFD